MSKLKLAHYEPRLTALNATERQDKKMKWYFDLYTVRFLIFFLFQLYDLLTN